MPAEKIVLGIVMRRAQQIDDDRLLLETEQGGIELEDGSGVLLDEASPPLEEEG